MYFLCALSLNTNNVRLMLGRVYRRAWLVGLCLVSLVVKGSAQESGRYFNLEVHSRGGYRVEGVEPFKETTSGRFAFDHLMVGVEGRFTPKLSYRYVQRFNKDATIYRLENLSNAIDYAFLKYQASDRVAVTVGRHAKLVGGFEFQEYPIDVYDFSWYDNQITCYLTGVSSSFQLSPTQELALQVTNSRTREQREAFGHDDIVALRFPLMGAMAWNSSYFGRQLRLRYAAAFAPLAKGKKMFTIGTGQKLDFGRFNIYLDLLYYHSDLDYLGVLRGHGIPAKAIERCDNLSTVLEARYSFSPQWQLQLKGIYDTARAKIYDETERSQINRQLYQAALQYYPMEGQHCYFFLSGTYQTFGHRGTLTVDTPDQFRCALGLVARLSLFSKAW